MDNSKSLITKIFIEKKPEEKRAEVDEYVKSRMEAWGEFYWKCKDEARREEIMGLCKAELETGICPRCQKKWKEFTFENVFGFLHYFIPDCECFPKCPHCHEFLYQEAVTGRMNIYQSKNKRCPRCGWAMILDGIKRFGSVYEVEQYHTDYKKMMLDKMYKKKSGKKENF